MARAPAERSVKSNPRLDRKRKEKLELVQLAQAVEDFVRSSSVRRAPLTASLRPMPPSLRICRSPPPRSPGSSRRTTAS